MNFWENVEAVREYKGMTRKELAYKADFSINSISTGITRNSIPAADVAYRVAKVLGVTVEFLITGNRQNSGVQTDEESRTEEKISSWREQFGTYADKYAKIMEDFVLLPPQLQSTVAELIHRIPKD